MMNASEILQIITLAVSGWTLREVIRIGRKQERHDQKLADLPCADCAKIMKTAILITFTAALTFMATGCGTVQKAVLTERATVTPPVTNFVQLITIDPAGHSVTNVTATVTPAVTNWVYAPNPVTQAGIQAVGALPIPWAGSAAIVGGWLLTAFAAYKNKKLNVALVKGIDAGRQILQTTPEGQKLDAKLKDALIEHQELAGVLNAASKLVNEYTGDTVKPQ